MAEQSNRFFGLNESEMRQNKNSSKEIEQLSGFAHFQRMAPALRLAALPSTTRLLSHNKNSRVHPLRIINEVCFCVSLWYLGIIWRAGNTRGGIFHFSFFVDFEVRFDIYYRAGQTRN